MRRVTHDIRTDVPKAMGGADRPPAGRAAVGRSLGVRAGHRGVRREARPRGSNSSTCTSPSSASATTGSHGVARARARAVPGAALARHRRGGGARPRPAETQARVDELARLVKAGAPSTRCAPRGPSRGAMATRSSGVRTMTVYDLVAVVGARLFAAAVRTSRESLLSSLRVPRHRPASLALVARVAFRARARAFANLLDTRSSRRFFSASPRRSPRATETSASNAAPSPAGTQRRTGVSTRPPR